MAGTTDVSPRSAHCASGRLQLIDLTAKPSWKELLDRHWETCPSWYAVSLKQDDRRFWDAVTGAGFYDCYFQHRIESAYEASQPCDLPAARPQPVQLFLPGLPPASGDPLESF